MIGHQQAHAAGQGITGLKTQLQLDSTGEATANGAQENGKDDMEVCYFFFITLQGRRNWKLRQALGLTIILPQSTKVCKSFHLGINFDYFSQLKRQ